MDEIRVWLVLPANGKLNRGLSARNVSNPLGEIPVFRRDLPVSMSHSFCMFKKIGGISMYSSIAYCGK